MRKGAHDLNSLIRVHHILKILEKFMKIGLFSSYIDETILIPAEHMGDKDIVQWNIKDWIVVYFMQHERSSRTIAVEKIVGGNTEVLFLTQISIFIQKIP